MEAPAFVAPELARRVGWATQSDALLYVNMKGVAVSPGKRTAQVVGTVLFVVVIAAIVAMLVTQKGNQSAASSPTAPAAASAGRAVPRAGGRRAAVGAAAMAVRAGAPHHARWSRRWGGATTAPARGGGRVYHSSPRFHSGRPRRRGLDGAARQPRAHPRRPGGRRRRPLRGRRDPRLDDPGVGPGRPGALAHPRQRRRGGGQPARGRGVRPTLRRPDAPVARPGPSRRRPGSRGPCDSCCSRCRDSRCSRRRCSRCSRRRCSRCSRRRDSRRPYFCSFATMKLIRLPGAIRI